MPCPRQRMYVPPKWFHNATRANTTPPFSPDLQPQTPEPTATWMGKSGGFKSLDHHWTDAKFATAGDSVDLWDHNRAEPTLSYQWGADSNNCVR